MRHQGDTKRQHIDLQRCWAESSIPTFAVTFEHKKSTLNKLFKFPEEIINKATKFASKRSKGSMLG